MVESGRVTQHLQKREKRAELLQLLTSLYDKASNLFLHDPNLFHQTPPLSPAAPRS
jgi:hypothetical protein